MTLVLAVPQSVLAVPGACPSGYTQVAKWEWPQGDDGEGPPTVHEGMTIYFSPFEGDPAYAGDDSYVGQGPNGRVGHWATFEGDEPPADAILIDLVVMTDGRENGGGDAVYYEYLFNPAVPEADYDAYRYLLDAGGKSRAISNLVFCTTEWQVSLSSFSASASRGTVALDWVTATEIDNAGFMLYRSTTADGPQTQVTANLVAAKGNDLTGASYRVTDTPGYGTFCYWLKDVDYSGQSSLHGPIVVKVLPAIRLPALRPSLPGQ